MLPGSGGISWVVVLVEWVGVVSRYCGGGVSATILLCEVDRELVVEIL